MATLISVLIIGAITGFLGRLILPGPDPLSIQGTIVLAVVGSFIGGFLGWVLFHQADADGLQPASIYGSLTGAALAVVIRRATSRSRTRM